MDRCVHSFTRRHTRLSHHTQIPYYHFATHTSHAHKPHPLITPPSTAASRHACGRPRRGAVAAVLPHWTHDKSPLPGGRLTRQLPPPANGHGRGALCERRDGTASAQWAPRLPGQPASRLHLQALCVRRLTISIPIGAAFGGDTRRIHTRSGELLYCRPRAHPGRMSAHAAAAAAQNCAVEPEFPGRDRPKSLYS